MAKKTLTAWVRTNVLSADVAERLLAGDTRPTLLKPEEILDGYARLFASQLRCRGGLEAYVDTVSGRKVSIFHDGPRLFDPEVSHFPGGFDEALPGYGGHTANELIARGRLATLIVPVPAYEAKQATTGS